LGLLFPISAKWALGNAGRKDQTVTIRTEKDKWAALGNPTQGHRINASLAPPAMFVIPTALHERKAIAVVFSTLEQDLHSVSALDWKPTAESSPTVKLIYGFVILSASRHKYVKRIESGDATLHE
jgi:hypothetical protein